MMEEIWKAYRILAEKPLGKESFTELRRWDDNIRTDFSEQDMMM